MKYKLEHFSQEAMDLYEELIPDISNDFLSESQYIASEDQKITLSLLRNVVEQKYILMKNMYQQAVECFGIKHKVNYASIYNPASGVPAHILTDGGTIEGNKYFLSGIVLDSDYKIHSIINGFSNKEASSILHEEMSLKLVLAYLKEHFECVNPNIVWHTDVSSGAAQKIIKYDKLRLSYNIANSTISNIPSVFFIEGMCHHLLNNYQIQQTLKGEESVCLTIINEIDEEYKNNIIVGDTVMFKDINQVKPLIRPRNLKIAGDVDLYNKIDISISGKLYNRSESSFSFSSDHTFSFDKISLKDCYVAWDVPSLEGRLIELYDTVIETPVLAPEIACRRSMTLKNCSIQKIADHLEVRKLFLYHCPYITNIADSMSCEHVVIHDCPKLNISEMKKKFPDTHFEVKKKLDRKLNGSEVSFYSNDSSSIKEANMYVRDKL